MASCHARAVMLRRKEYQDEIDYNIALTVANHMGSGGRPATVSLATIAEYSHCHYNTADKRAKRMSDLGQLVIGRSGRLLAYSVPYDGDEEESEGDGAAVSEISEMRQDIAVLKEQVGQLTAAITQLSHDLHTIVTSSSHELHTSVTSPAESDVNKVGKNGSKEELLPPAKSERKMAIAELEGHFATISGLPLPKRKTEKEQRGSAVTWWTPLGDMWEQMGRDVEATKQYITAVVTKMRRDGLNISSPQSTLKVFQSEVSAAKSAIPAIGNQFEKVLAAAQTGDWTGVDEPSKQVARDMGGLPLFKGMRPDQAPMYRKQFYERLNGHAIH